MRHPQSAYAIVEGDMTPMIDMVFQLMAFFLFALNFTQADQNERIKLPESELAKPPDGVLSFPITLHVTKEGKTIIAGDEVPVAGLAPYLSREATLLEMQKRPLADATLIIRGDRGTQAGKVQEVIRECQRHKFEKFVLRAQEKVGH